MDKDSSSFFQTEEFHQTLAKYEEMQDGGKAVYLDGDQLSDIAEYYASNDQYGKALEAMDYALRLHPDDADLMAMKGSLLLETGETEEARKIASQITASTYNTLYLKAGILLKDNHPKQAERLLKTMVYNEPDVDEDCFLDAAYLYMDNGYPHEAIQWFEKALRTNPWNATTQQDYAECCYRSNELERAIQWYDKALDENPYSTECWFGLAKAYSLKEDYAEAFNALDFVLAIDSAHQPAILLKAHVCFELKNYEAASGLYLKYAEKNPEESYPLYMAGECFFCLNQTNEALRHFQKAMKQSPDPDPFTIDIFQDIAFCYAKHGQSKKALEIIEKVIQADDEGNPSPYILKGETYLMGRQPAEAEKAFRMALEKDHFQNPETYSRIAFAYVDNLYIDEAISVFKLLEGKFPDYGSSAVCMSYLYLLKRDDRSFEKYLKKAIEKDPRTVKQFMDEHLSGLPKIQQIYKEYLSLYEAQNAHS